MAYAKLQKYCAELNSTDDSIFFHWQFPISFAINLSVKKEQLIRKTHKTHAAMKLQQKEDNKKNGPSDEVDTGRTYRRFKKYEESVRDFIDYFRESDRLLTVDTSSGRNDVVWESIKTYFQDSEFVPMLRPVELVLLFCFGKSHSWAYGRVRATIGRLIIYCRCFILSLLSVHQIIIHPKNLQFMEHYFLLPFLNPATYHLPNLRSINLILSPSPRNLFLLSSFFRTWHKLSLS